MEKIRHSNAGMTLIEVILAAGITATVLTMIFSAMISMGMITEINESRTAASEAVASIIEDMVSRPFDEVLEYIPPRIEGPGRYHYIEVGLVLPAQSASGGETGEGNELNIVFLPVDPETFDDSVLPNPVEVGARITWQEPNGRVFQVYATTTMER